ncbi:MAG: hypothetical protein WA919_22155 [Coleofasciculaceae cyanobacterium]
MFEKIRYRLLLSYLAVLTVILGVFAIAVRITYTHSLNQQLKDRLETLAKAAALELELDGGEIQVDQEDLVNDNQAIQWFDLDGNLLAEQGNRDYILKQPFNPKQTTQVQSGSDSVMSLSIPVADKNKGLFIGYTRVSESTQELNKTLRSLDCGLGVGVVIALGLTEITPCLEGQGVP